VYNAFSIIFHYLGHSVEFVFGSLISGTFWMRPLWLLPPPVGGHLSGLFLFLFVKYLNFFWLSSLTSSAFLCDTDLAKNYFNADPDPKRIWLRIMRLYLILSVRCETFGLDLKKERIPKCYVFIVKTLPSGSGSSRPIDYEKFLIRSTPVLNSGPTLTSYFTNWQFTKKCLQFKFLVKNHALIIKDAMCERTLLVRRMITDWLIYFITSDLNPQREPDPVYPLRSDPIRSKLDWIRIVQSSILKKP
jgi:hypothetical protein